MLSEYDVTNLLDISSRYLDIWNKNGKLRPVEKIEGIRYYSEFNLMQFPIAEEVFNTDWDNFIEIKPLKRFTSVELFAGAGGMALGLEKAGFHNVLLNEFDKDACETLRRNKPNWNVTEGDIKDVDFNKYLGKVDLVSGGFPCQAFSHAGKKLGFEDTRGTLFFEFARCVKEIQPKVLMGENVKGLFTHDKGRTLETIKNTIDELGYTLIEPQVLKSIYYKVPQKRERLFLVAIRNDLREFIQVFKYPEKYHRVLTVKDAFSKGELFDSDVPNSDGSKYPERKREIMDVVPEGGYWRDLPEDLQKEYMGGSYYLGGGKTGLARRLSMKKPSLTLVCSPAMKQTERCHPVETRPLTIRESARIQTFPDNWFFHGSKIAQYKQIGNAVPVNLAHAMGISVIRLLNEISKLDQKEISNSGVNRKTHLTKSTGSV